MSIDVAIADGRRDLARFIDLPHDLHGGERCYVPQLNFLQKEMLGRRSPFRQHSEMQLFLARRAGRVVGRIAALHNRRHDEHHGTRQGFFGFFECGDDAEAAVALVDTVRDWTASRGLIGLLGPVNPDLNNGCGVVVEGHDRPPMVFMPWNPAYYGGLLEAAGLVRVKHLNAWETRYDGIPEPSVRHAARIRERLEARGYVLRHLDMGNFAAEARTLREVYNASLAGSWGHVPLTAEEFDEQAKGLKLICPAELIPVAEYEGRIVGFIGAAPDVNEVLRRLPRGRLLPWGWLRLLAARRGRTWSRVVMYGVDPAHRGSALAAWLYIAMIQAVGARGLAGTEASYVLDDNAPVNGLSRKLGGVLTKRYAIYGEPDAGGRS